MSSGELSDQLNRWLHRVDQYIWPDQHQPDNNCHCFYTFKPFPRDLTSRQIKSWAELQCNALSPFKSGDRYYYLSTQGLHLWISQEKFTGLPETAAQTRLADGQHKVAGKTFHYQQTWSNGIMTSCITLPMNGREPKNTIDHSQPWAKKLNIDTQIRLPRTWLVASIFGFLCVFTWIGAGALTLYSQHEIAANTGDRLNAEISDKLAKQSQLREQQANLYFLHAWGKASGSLPEAFGSIAERINPLGLWEVKEIAWQDRQLLVELDTGDIDIAALVKDLELVSGIKAVSIRPHGSAGTYLLEASFHE